MMFIFGLCPSSNFYVARCFGSRLCFRFQGKTHKLLKLRAMLKFDDSRSSENKITPSVYRRQNHAEQN